MVKGRPRSFDVDKVLERAIHVFWEKGYEGASLADLTSAMGINRPSMYAAFGNKEALFRKALDRYCEQSRADLREALAGPSARKAMRELFDCMIDHYSGDEHPRGCLMMQSHCNDEAEPIQRELAARRHLLEDTLHERLTQARREGELPKKTDTADLARYFATVLQGMTLQASSGASRKQLRNIADLAMRAWPA